MSVTIRVMNCTATIEDMVWQSTDPSLTKLLNAATHHLSLSYQPWPDMGIASALAREFGGEVIASIDPDADDDGFDQSGLPRIY